MIDRVVCISLDRRPDRWEAFCAQLPGDWPFGPVARFPAVDGRLVQVPEWYGAMPPNLNHRPRDWASDMSGAWGCLQSHRQAWQAAIADGTETLLVLEDDASFCCAFGLHVRKFLEDVPDDWEWLYLGGQHLDDCRRPPVAVAEGVLRCRNVNRTHAYILRRCMLERLCDLTAGPWPAIRHQDYHLDHRLGTIHDQHRVYAPRQWLVGQAAGVSDVDDMRVPEYWWRRFNVALHRADSEDGIRQTAAAIA